MATTVTNPAQTFQFPEDKQYPLYTSQETSPASSASPTSPRMSEYLHHYAPNPAKQIRPLQKPLYVPAVLRPTEHYAPSPMSPPRILNGSVDSLREQENEEAHAAAQRDLDLALHHQFSQEEDLGAVTGPPTRDHWKPDEASPNCDSPKCRSSFNLFIRKHHCRHCGHIFCSTHAQYTIPLDQFAKFHPDGVQSRACEACHKQYSRWDTARSIKRKNSDNSSNESFEDAASGAQTPVHATSPSHQRMISSGGIRRDQQPQPPVANSVPKDWAWSTF